MNINENALIDAIRKSIKNSEELLSDAQLLLQNKRLPRAYALYQLSMEEAGKAMDIFGNIILGLLNTHEGVKKFKRTFKNHVEKSQIARMMSLSYALHVTEENKEIGEKLVRWIMKELGEADVLNDYKNYSLYTSYIDNAYKMPSEIITQERVNYIEMMATHRLLCIKTYLDIGLNNLHDLQQYSLENPMTEEKNRNMIKEFIGEFDEDFLIKLWGDSQLNL